MDTLTIQELINSSFGILSSFNHTNLHYVCLLLSGIICTRGRWALEGRLVVKILQCDYHCDCNTRPYCFGVVGITVVTSNTFSLFFFLFFLSFFTPIHLES